MKHLSTFPVANGLRLHYLLGKDHEGVFPLDLGRTAIGLSLEEKACFAVVMGERILSLDRRTERERRRGGGEMPLYGRYFVVLDEAETSMPQEMIGRLIELKDEYRAGTVYGPDRPVHLVESVRGTEGLTHYLPEYQDYRLAVAQWPTFVDFDIRAGYYGKAVPDEQTVHRDLEFGLSSHAKDPKTGKPLIGVDGKPIPVINLPVEMDNLKTRSGIRQAYMPSCTALWFVYMGMSKSWAIPRTTEMEHEHVGNSITGY